MNVKYTIGNIIDFCENENIDYLELLTANLGDSLKVSKCAIRLVQLGMYDKGITQKEAERIVNDELRNRNIDIFDLYIELCKRMCDSGFFIRGDLTEKILKEKVEKTPAEELLNLQMYQYLQAINKESGK